MSFSSSSSAASASSPSLKKWTKKTEIYHLNLDFLRSCPNTFGSTTFHQGIESTQRIHSWICLDLRKVGKLLRSGTNSQILRNLHVSDPTAKDFDKPI